MLSMTILLFVCFPSVLSVRPSCLSVRLSLHLSPPSLSLSLSRSLPHPVCLSVCLSYPIGSCGHTLGTWWTLVVRHCRDIHPLIFVSCPKFALQNLIETKKMFTIIFLFKVVKTDVPYPLKNYYPSPLTNFQFDAFAVTADKHAGTSRHNKDGELKELTRIQANQVNYSPLL